MNRTSFLAHSDCYILCISGYRAIYQGADNGSEKLSLEGEKTLILNLLQLMISFIVLYTVQNVA